MRSSVRKITGKFCGDYGAYVLLICFCGEFFCLLEIGEKAAFDQYPSAVNTVQKIDPLPFFNCPAAARIQSIDKGSLQLTCQFLTARCIGIEYLGTGIPAVRKMVLMDTQ